MPTSSHRHSSSGSSVSSRRSSSAADSDEDSFIVGDSEAEIEDAQPKKSKTKGASKSSRPALKKGGASSGIGGSGYSFLTAAEQREQGKKNEKKSTEDPYSFLQDVRDVRSILTSIVPASIYMISIFPNIVEGWCEAGRARL
jgi:DNA mismatch repair protein MSH6